MQRIKTILMAPVLLERAVIDFASRGVGEFIIVASLALVVGATWATALQNMGAL